MSVSDPKTRVDYEVEVVTTGAAVYAASNPYPSAFRARMLSSSITPRRRTNRTRPLKLR